jgi:hypothetical protein
MREGLLWRLKWLGTKEDSILESEIKATKMVRNQRRLNIRERD